MCLYHSSRWWYTAAGATLCIGSSVYPHQMQRHFHTKGEFQQTLGSATSQVNPGIHQTSLYPMRHRAGEQVRSSLSVLFITTSTRKTSPPATSRTYGFPSSISRDTKQPSFQKNFFSIHFYTSIFLTS